MIIEGKKIGLNKPTFFIADIAANHDGSLSRAKKLIKLCAKAGATGLNLIGARKMIMFEPD